MRSLINLTYMDGAGNTFTVVDDRLYNIPNKIYSAAASRLCSEHHKTEGLIILRAGNDVYDFIAEFFNPDGSGSTMCGNGGRCAVRFAVDNGFSDKKELFFEMVGNEYRAVIGDKNIQLFLPAPSEFRASEVKSEGLIRSGNFVDVGSAHFVINQTDCVDISTVEIRQCDLTKFAPPLRYNAAFAPVGVNVNLYSIIDRSTIDLRTWEKGVEGETGACGTGAVSTALSAYGKGEIDFPLTIIPPSGQKLIIDCVANDEDEIETVILEGPAQTYDNNNIEMIY
jgi:diaminopimelate epimerase